jgi:hypothetical protein
MQEVDAKVSIIDNDTSSSHPTNVVETSNIVSHQCQICGEFALHSNYGAMTCSPCKMFFKRNATTDRVSHHNYILVFLFIFISLETIPMCWY